VAQASSARFDPLHPIKSLTVPRDALHPPSSDNARLGIGLSLIAHAGLIVALWLAVQWRTETPVGVSAELWAAVPEIAAPRAEPQPQPEPQVAPPPPPRAATPPQPTPEEREAEIAIEKARKEKLEKERREAQDQKAREKRLRDEKERKDREKQQAEKERLERDKAEAKQREKDKLEQQRKDQAAAASREKARQDQLKRMNEQLGGGTGAPGSTGTAARDAGPSANYAGRIVARIRPNITFPFELAGNPTADVRLVVMPDGTITRWEVVKSSGVKEWDEAVLRAVEKTAVLPRDENGRVPSPMVLSVSRYPRS
jgi:colicin import membrane protein